MTNEILNWISYQNLEITNFENNELYYKYLCDNAASDGKINVLSWIIENNLSDFDELTCASAALSGKIDVLKWLRNKYNCRWDEETSIRALEGEHIKLFEWLVEEKCPININECIEISSNMDFFKRYEILDIINNKNNKLY